MLPNDKTLERRMEEAHQAKLEGEYNEESDSATPTPTPTGFHRTKKLTFADAALATPASQTSSTYKEVLSQPARGLTHRQKLQWLQQRRGAGLWVQCDDCDQWRYMPNALDAYDLPSQWHCPMNPDKSFADCSVPEAPIHVRDEEDLIHGPFSCGSVVWARLAGFPWWPALVDDEPDTEQFYWLDGFSDIPTYYNVTFLDDAEVTHAWIPTNQLKPYAANRGVVRALAKDKKYKKRLGAAIIQAEDALRLPHQNRLAKYSFVARYSGAINKPRKVSTDELKKFTDRLKRKYNIDFSDESSEDSDESDKDFEVRKRSKMETAVRKTKAPKEKVVKSILVGPKTTKPNKKVEVQIPTTTNPNKELEAKTSEPIEEPLAKIAKTTDPIAKTTDTEAKIQDKPLQKVTEMETESEVIQHKGHTAEPEPNHNGDTMCSTNESFDNDTSDTYVPLMMVNETQSTLSETQDTDRTIVETPKMRKDTSDTYVPLMMVNETQSTLSETQDTDRTIVETPKMRKDSFIPARKLQDSIDCSGTSAVSEQFENMADSDVFKKPSSMTLQVGSNTNKDVVECFDNDTSTTYVPETESDASETIEDIEACIREDVRKLKEKSDSATSDDFDF